MTSAVPFLTFQPSKGPTAAAALRFYLDLFDDSRLVFQQHHPDASPGAGTIMLAEFTVGGLRVRCSDSFVDHAWDFTPAVSLWLDCASDEQQRRLFDGLSAGGRVHMPVDDYGFGPFGWVDDQFGVSWQLAVDANTQHADRGIAPPAATAVSDRSGNQIATEPEPDRIDLEVAIDTDAMAAWQFISQPGWFINDGALTDHEVSWDGATATVVDPVHGQFRFTRESLNPPHHVADRAVPGEQGDESRVVEFWVTEARSGVTVRVVESGFTSMPVSVEDQIAQHEQNTKTWRQQLDLARKHLQT